MSDEYDEDDMDCMEYDPNKDDSLCPNTGDCEGAHHPTIDKGNEKSLEYESLSPKQLIDYMSAEIQHIVDVSGLDYSIASILCRHYKWNVAGILERYMESPKSVMAAIGEVDQISTSIPPTKEPGTSAATELICAMCSILPETAMEGIYQVRCGHHYCIGCWSSYVRQKVKYEGQCTLQCMDDNCTVSLTDADVKNLTDAHLYTRYHDLLVKSFVHSASFLKSCPHPGCDQTVLCNDVTPSTLTTVVPIVSCAAGHHFCFGCDGEDHRPAICEVVRLWLTNAPEDLATDEWVKANSIACPRCTVLIENGGCRRVDCPLCFYQFCSACRGSWHSYDHQRNYWPSNTFSESERSDQERCQNSFSNPFSEPESGNAKTAAQRNLDRWLFYFDRWNKHALNGTLYEMVEDKVMEVQVLGDLSWIEAHYIKEAAEELNKCRVTLKWSYSMAFFLEAGNSKQFFEDMQSDLEKAVEDLSQLLEKATTASSVTSSKQRMLDKIAYVQKRHRNFLDMTAKGLLEDQWEWTVPVE